MPALSLPEVLNEELEAGTINKVDGPGVAAYESANGTVRSDVYLRVNNKSINSAVNPVTKIQFTPAPNDPCKYDDFVFDPSKDEIISIKVSRRIKIQRVSK